MKLLLLLTLIGIVFGDTPKSYLGYQVLRTHPSNAEQIIFLKDLVFKGEYMLWTEAVIDRPVDVMVPPDNNHLLKEELEVQEIPYEIMIFDVDEQMKAESFSGNVQADFQSAAGHPMTWDEYHPVEHIDSFLFYLQNTYTFVTTEVIGQSFEGRNMTVAKICKGVCGDKPAVWIDGGIHAREWISSATVTWMLRELVENDISHPELTENMDW